MQITINVELLTLYTQLLQKGYTTSSQEQLPDLIAITKLANLKIFWCQHSNNYSYYVGIDRG